MSNHKCIGDIRGIGHFWAVELVKNRETRESFDSKADKFVKPSMADRLAEEAMRRGLYIQGWYDHLSVVPPLIIEEHDVERGLGILDDVLRIADAEVEE